MEDIVSRLEGLVFSFWFYCLRIHVDLYVPDCTVLPSGTQAVCFLLLRNPTRSLSRDPTA